MTRLHSSLVSFDYGYPKVFTFLFNCVKCVLTKSDTKCYPYNHILISKQMDRRLHHYLPTFGHIKKNIFYYSTLTNFSTKYLVMCKVNTDVGGINSYVCLPVRKIIHSLKPVDYLHIQANNPWYNYYLFKGPITAITIMHGKKTHLILKIIIGFEFTDCNGHEPL